MSTSFTWTDLSKNPNDPRVVRRRQGVLDSARRAPVDSRPAHLRDLASGRSVLDIGVVEHFSQNQERNQWLHRSLVEVARSCKGVDVLAEDVALLVEKGYDVVVHDLTESPLDGTYQVVVMGDIIEHLGDPQRFLTNVRPMMEQGSRLVITTPNPYMLHRVWHALRGRFNDSVDHALLLGPDNLLELASRCGFVLDAWRGVRLKDLSGMKNRVASVARAAAIRAGGAPELACDTLIYEFVPATASGEELGAQGATGRD